MQALQFAANSIKRSYRCLYSGELKATGAVILGRIASLSPN